LINEIDDLLLGLGVFASKEFQFGLDELIFDDFVYISGADSASMRVHGLVGNLIRLPISGGNVVILVEEEIIVDEVVFDLIDE
jgi:hypothetical protein